jgi:hypothetical protein
MEVRTQVMARRPLRWLCSGLQQQASTRHNWARSGLACAIATVRSAAGSARLSTRLKDTSGSLMSSSRMRTYNKVKHKVFN